MAIGIRLKKTGEEVDLGASKFFGDPTIPNEWADKWSDDVIFLCQIRLEDIADIDDESVVPHEGYIYFFLDTEFYPYTPMVYYYNGEPDTVLDGFNAIDSNFEYLTEALEMEFELVEDNAEGMKLFGLPADWSHEEQPPKLFLQFDPLAENNYFWTQLDGFAYFFFGDDMESFDDVYLAVEES